MRTKKIAYLVNSRCYTEAHKLVKSICELRPGWECLEVFGVKTVVEGEYDFLLVFGGGNGDYWMGDLKANANRLPPMIYVHSHAARPRGIKCFLVIHTKRAVGVDLIRHIEVVLSPSRKTALPYEKRGEDSPGGR